MSYAVEQRCTTSLPQRPDELCLVCLRAQCGHAGGRRGAVVQPQCGCTGRWGRDHGPAPMQPCGGVGEGTKHGLARPGPALIRSSPMELGNLVGRKGGSIKLLLHPYCHHFPDPWECPQARCHGLAGHIWLVG